MSLSRFSNRNASTICVWGDSRVVGSTGTNALTRVCSVFANKFTPTRKVVNCGIGGDTIRQQLDRILNMPQHQRDWCHIFFFGGVGQDFSASLFIGIVDRAMEFVPHDRKLLMGPTNSATPLHAKTPPGDRYQPRLDARAHVSTAYPNNWLDIHQVLMDANDGSAGDLDDIAQEFVPRSLRGDDVHHNDAGQEIIAEAWYQSVISRRW
jgi:lysophospholipase L1-like esterase